MLNSLLDKNFKVATIYNNLNKSDIYDSEYILVENASSKRKIDFIRGRLCAKKTLQKLGVNNYPILMGKHKEPLWPSTVVGSITHCNGYCAATVAFKNHIIGVGIDAEINTKLSCKLIPTTQSNNEIERNKSLISAVKSVCINKLTFSAKESIFKFVYPITKQYINFKDVEVEFKFENKSFSIIFLKTNLRTVFENSKLIGKFDYNKTHIVTCVYELVAD